MAFKMKGMAFKNTDDSNKLSANYMSYDDLINSKEYQDALKSKKKQTFTHFSTTSDFPGGPEKKIVRTVTTGEV